MFLMPPTRYRKKKKSTTQPDAASFSTWPLKHPGGRKANKHKITIKKPHGKIGSQSLLFTAGPPTGKTRILNAHLVT